MTPAVLVAMPEELAPFLAASEDLKEVTEQKGFRIGGGRFFFANLAGKPVLLVATGIGLVNAAMAATVAITQFGADALINSGSAGGVGKEVRVGDVVVSDETCYSTADATAFTNYALGQVPQMPARFISDPRLRNAIPADAETRIHYGLTLASDAFIWEKNYADYVGKFPDALSTDMETAAIGQVAYQFGVPWISMRGVSDLCGPQGADDFKTHLDGAANIAANVVIQLLESLASVH
jgi:adenosylhomocysteine nucleosidase